VDAAAAVLGVKTRFAPREIADLQAEGKSRHPARDPVLKLSGRSTSQFSASSVWAVSTRFRLQIAMITGCERSFGTPQAQRRLAKRQQPPSRAARGTHSTRPPFPSGGQLRRRAERDDERRALSFDLRRRLLSSRNFEAAGIAGRTA
jgi:hypothetical protein